MNWNQFRPELFSRMEERRSKAIIFRLEQIHCFINDCSKLHVKPGTQEAEEALNRIGNEGTFLLAAESLRDFLELFPAVEPQPQPQEAAEQQRPITKPALARRSSGSPFRQ